MVRFRMFKINVEQFAVLTDKLPRNTKDISLETRLSFKAAKDNKIAPVVRFSFEKSKQPIILIEVCCEFDIHPDDWKNMIIGDDIVIPKETLEILTVQTVGVTRGVLFCKTEGTPFNVFILPPINVASMIKKDIKISLP